MNEYTMQYLDGDETYTIIEVAFTEYQALLNASDRVGTTDLKIIGVKPLRGGNKCEKKERI